MPRRTPRPSPDRPRARPRTPQARPSGRGTPKNAPRGPEGRLLFCYGSNHPAQLAERLGRPVDGLGAHLPGHGRVFRGWSQRWGGGVATVAEDPKRTVYGYVAEVSEEDLDRLDRFEGTHSGVYRRVTLPVRVRLVDGREVTRKAALYVHRDSEKPAFSTPSTAHLEAVAKTVGAFWAGTNSAPVKPSDFPLV